MNSMNKIRPVEGKSLAPILRGEQRAGHGALFFEHVGGRAALVGDWKLVALKGKPWSLFHLAGDRTETRDLAAEQPDRVKSMAAQWDEWAKRVGAVAPKPKVKKKPKPKSS